MTRSMTPERAELICEALQLREFGWTQQDIAIALHVPQQTISDWLRVFGNGTRNDVGNHPAITESRTGAITEITSPPIRLFPCRYEDAAPHIPDGSVDLILTDPPYLASSNDISRNNQRDLQRDFGRWDKTPVAQYEALVPRWAEFMARELRDRGSLYLFTGYRQSPIWCMALEEAGLTYTGLLVWHRSNPAPQIRKTRWCPAFDLVVFFSKGTPACFRWIGQNEMHNVLECRAAEIESHWFETGPICGGNERQWHPTQKPRWLLEKLLWVSSEPGSHILDPFAGSGSTAFAALRLPGRHVTLIEPEPKYVGLIRSIAQEEFQCTVILEPA